MSSPARPDRRLKVSPRSVGAWLILVGVVTFFDGMAGLGIAVVVAAVALAKAPAGAIGAVGVAALVAVPLVVLGQGLPTEANLSPAFVSDSLWAHHLTFFGLGLVFVWVVIDVAAQLVRDPLDPDDLIMPSLVSLVLLGLVAIGAIAASLAVIST